MKLLPNEFLGRLKSQIGVTHSFTTPDPLSSGTFRQYFEVVGDFNPVYFDHEFAKSIGHPRLLAPPTLICESEQFSDQVAENNIFSGRICFNGDWYNWLRAGNAYEFYNPAKIGDVIVTKKIFEDVWLKKGKNGNHIFKQVNIFYTNQNGDRLAKNEETMFITLA